MKPLIVYRLENEEGFGPFRGGHRAEAEGLLGHKNPLFYDNKLSNRRKSTIYKKGWVYAWSCSDTFDLWMNGKEKLMFSLGYSKVAYKTYQYRAYFEQELWEYIESEEDYRKTLAKGSQVVFNPRASIIEI